MLELDYLFYKYLTQLLLFSTISNVIILKQFSFLEKSIDFIKKKQ